ncbi:MAG: type I-C CRISPR-associated protein Cas7/Csd2 [Chloroflexi bacterium]|nr:type I-C CRISPR-associated protein Cas7/Csd2 [Chloroflexota bacterium]
MTATSTPSITTDTGRRHDFVLLFDVRDGNPNGDPDAGNLPRVDPETMQGLVTDVAIKRKVRDYVDLARGSEGRFKIYIQSGSEALNTIHQRAYDDLGIKSTGTKQAREDVDRAREWMCRNFFDIRTFGAVMSTGVNCGQVRGPVQLTFARSVDPIIPLDLSITRVAVTRQEDAAVVESEEEGGATTGKQTEMGRKSAVPYGLYRAHGFFNPHFAEKTQVDGEDLALFWRALEMMWDVDRSASRGEMACRGLYVFTHESKLGNAAAHRLFDLIQVPSSEAAAPRSFADYHVECPADGSLEGLPGVTLTSLVG